MLTDAKTPVNSYTITLGNDTNPANTIFVQAFSFNVLSGGTVTPGTSTSPPTGPTNGTPPPRSYSTVIGSYAFAGNNFPQYFPGPPPYTGYRFRDVITKYLFTTTYDSTQKNVTITSQFSWDTLWGAYGFDPYTKNCTHADGPLYGNVTFDMRGGLKKADSPPDCSGDCAGCSGGNKHMAGASLEKFQAGITITDTPISYTPGVGPAMNFSLRYRQRQTNQPATFNFSNLGQQWNGSWVGYIGDGPTNGEANATYHAPNGGTYIYGNYQPVIGVGATVPNQGDFEMNDGWTHATLHYRQGPERYERWLPDGTVEKYALIVGTSPNRLFFLTSITDPQGNVTTLTYDPAQANNGNAVLNSVTDPTGGQLTFSYNASASNPFLISKVTRSNDGLSAKFQYTNGQLTSISDTIGITSSFHYTSGTSFIDKMTTPYGQTTFNSSDGAGYLEADMTNPLGQNERVEYQEALSLSLFPAPIGGVPPTPNGSLVPYDNLQTADTFYWTRRAMNQLGSNSPDTSAGYALAQVTHWAESPLGSISVPLSTEMPLEGRVWYNYPAQTGPDTIDLTVAAATTSPSLTARLLDDGTTQYSSATYTASGLIASSTDPKGRTTNYSYDPNNNIDLLQVTQSNSASSSGLDVLSTMTYNQSPTLPLHVPITIKDASGQTATLSYYPNGQLNTRTVVVAGANQTTTLTYWPNTWYLEQVTGPITGATTNYAYDTSGRVHTVTDSEGYTLTFAYDNLDRPTVTTYPNGNTEQTIYNKLDVSEQIDRQGRATYNYYDAIRELLQTTDPLGRGTWYTWCTCGGLSTLTDANGNVTTWGLDLQGRVTSKTYAGHTSPDISYVYETNMSRLHSMTDANGNVATYSYNSDNTLASSAYTPGTGIAATPNVSFTYDTAYNRVLTMLDGTGTTTYAYNPITTTATLGAGRLASVTSPIYGTSSTAVTTYTYDELGRVVGRGVDQATTNLNNVSTTFDALGRVTNISNALGAFAYAYVDQTSRLSGVTYPSGTGLTTSYSYFNNVGDQRLQEIKNLVGTTPLSKWDYTYNPVGTIATWTQQADSNTAVVDTLTYDNADQLAKDQHSGGSSTSDAFGYDSAGNRVTETNSSGTTTGQFNSLNQLTGSSSSSTAQTVAGHTSAPVSSVSVNAVVLTPGSGITNGTNFSASVPLPSGTNIISVTAQPTSGPLATQAYQIVTTGTAPTALTYDSNGNILTDKSGNCYLWDALNRLVRITYPGSGPQKLSGTVIGTSGSNGNSGNVIANAFDGNTSTYFDGPTADGCWLGLDLGSNHPAVTQIKYTCRAGYGSRMVGGQFQISSASDFSSGVVTLATITTAPSDGVPVAVPITGATEERYVRYLGPSGSYGDIAELEFDSSSCSEFAYDGLSRRVQIVEQAATGSVTSTKNYLWIGQAIAEERSATNSVTKRFFPQGEQQSGTPYYYTRDHLGSVREMMSGTGTIIARYSYDDYGRRTYVQGSGSSTFQYTGDYYHATSGLNFTLYRAYDPNTGRWLSRDPLKNAEMREGPNLYDYVYNDPVNYLDPSGRYGRLSGVFGAIAGGVGGATTGYATGGYEGAIEGGLSGAVSGSILGFFTPEFLGPAGDFLGGAVSSYVGQVAGNFFGGDCHPFGDVNAGAIAFAGFGGVASGLGAYAAAATATGALTLSNGFSSGVIAAGSELLGGYAYGYATARKDGYNQGGTHANPPFPDPLARYHQQ